MTPDLPARWRPFAYALLGLYAAWLLVGVLPIAPLEGDEQGVISGATALARGELAYLDLAYLPAIQPGSYALLAAASNYTGFAVETIFAGGTVAGAVLFIAFAALLLARTVAAPLWVCLAALFACQEISAAAYYMNTTALGLWLAFCGLWLATRPPTWKTAAAIAVCIAVAGWIRVDCLLPAPAVLVLLWLNTRDLRTTLLVTAVIAASATILVVVLYGSCGVTWTDLFVTYSTRGAINGWGPTLRALPLILSPLVCGLSLGGIALLFFRREWALLALMVTGSAATLFVYGTSLASTKYFYHLVPFFLVGALYSARAIITFVATAKPSLRYAAIAAGVFTIGGDQALALHTSSPKFRRYVPAPVVATLAEFSRPDRAWRLVIGPGELIPTADGFRLRTGALFAPWVWRREKIAQSEQMDRFAAVLRSTQSATVYYSGWLPYQIITRILRAENFQFTSRRFATNSMPYSGEWSRGNQRIRTDYLAYQTSPYFDPNRHPAHSAGETVFFLGDLNYLEPISPLTPAGDWRPLWTEHHYRFVTFLQHRPRSEPFGPSLR